MSSQMVDAGAEAESMVEKLTDENMSLSTRVAQLQTAVQDLEEAAELNDELDASQRTEITELRRELEDSRSQQTTTALQCAEIKSKLEESMRSARRAAERCEEFKEQCRALEAELLSLSKGDVGELEKERQRQFAAAQRAVVWYSDRCESLGVASARAEIDANALRAQHARALSLLPSGSSSAVGSRVDAELRLMEAEVAATRALDVAARVFRALKGDQYASGGVAALQVNGQTAAKQRQRIVLTAIAQVYSHGTAPYCTLLFSCDRDSR
jgi:chromosome segregation ATPase